MKTEKQKATLEQKKIVYKKIVEWLQNLDEKEQDRVMDILKKSNERKE
jgi:type II secretory pathway component PulM